MASAATHLGDLAGLRQAADRLRAAAAVVDQSAARIRTHRERLAGCWSGPAADTCQESLETTASLTAEVGQVLRAVADVIDEYAFAVDQAHAQIGMLDQQRASLDTGQARLQRPGTVSPERAIRAQEDYQDSIARLDSRQGQVEEDLRAAARLARAKLEALARQIGPASGSSPEQLAASIAQALLTKLPVLAEHPDWVEGVVWASMTRIENVPVAVSRGVGWLWAAGQGPVRPPAPTWANSELLTGALEQVWKPGAQLLKHPLVAGTAPSESLLRGSLASLPSRAGLVRGLGVAGGVVATSASLVNVAAQGNPADAFERSGAEYVADVAELGFNASLTALMIAPNPVTAGLTVATGVAYGASELVAHWDDVTALWNDTTEVAGQIVGEADQVADAAGELAGMAVGEISEVAGSVAGALNPFD